MYRDTMTKQTTKQEYYDWVSTEPLADPCVDAENVGNDFDSTDYWTRMLHAGKQAVADRKEERAYLDEMEQQRRDEGIWEDNGCKWPNA